MKNFFARCGVSASLALITLAVSTVDLPTAKHHETPLSKFVFPNLASAQGISEEQARMQVYEKANPATVAILTGKGSGSGFIVSSEGLIVTNAHVVEGGPSTVTVVMADGRRLSADVIGFDVDGWDLAALRVYGQKNLPSLGLAGNDSVRVGQSVYAIGTPFGEVNSTILLGEGLVGLIQKLASFSTLPQSTLVTLAALY